MATNPIGYARNPITGQMQFVGRLKRPSYYCDVSAGKVVYVDASTAKPVTLLIGSKLYNLTNNLTCNLSNSGAGGLEQGTLAANKPYYLYIVDDSNELKLIASANDPDTGLATFADWTYIGACATDEGSAYFTEFHAANGFYLSNEEIEKETESSGGSRSGHAYSSMPVTAKKAWVQFYAVGGAGSANEFIRCSGVDSAADSLGVRIQVDNQGNFTHGWVPIFTSQTIYITSSANSAATVDLDGWQEDPMEWK